MTAETKRPIPGFFWTRDSRLILYVKDNDGDENFNVWAVDPGATKAEGKDVPPSRNLTDAKGARAYIYDVPKKAPDTIYVGLNDRDAAWHDLYKVTISTAKRELVRKNTDRIAGLAVRPRGSPPARRARHGQGRHRGPEGRAGGLQDGLHLQRVRDVRPRPLPQGRPRVYMETNKGDVDLTRLVLFDPETGKEELVESDPMNRVDFGDAFFSEATDELVATSYQDERTRVLLPRQGVGGGLRASAGRSSPARTSRPGRRPPTTGSC